MIFAVAAVLPFDVEPAQAASCIVEPKVVTLFAGQSIEAGSVTNTNDAANLYVTFEAAEPWLMSQTHLHAADSLVSIPQTKTGNLQVGKFAHQTGHVPAARHNLDLAPVPLQRAQAGAGPSCGRAAAQCE